MPKMRKSLSRRVRQSWADRELDALGVITAAILGVTSEEAARIIRYLNARFANVLKEHPVDEAGARSCSRLVDDTGRCDDDDCPIHGEPGAA